MKLVPTPAQPSARHGMPLHILLVNFGRSQAQYRRTDANHQVSMLIAAHFANPCHLEPDRFWVRPRRYHKVILDLPLIAVINQIDSGVYVLVVDLGIRGDAGMPFFGVVADEIISLAAQLIRPTDRCTRIRPQELHLDRGDFVGTLRYPRVMQIARLEGRLGYGHHRALWSEEQRVTISSREEPHAAVALALV